MKAKRPTPSQPGGLRMLESANLRGMAWMALSTVGFSAMHASVRYLSEEMHPFEIAFFRNFFGVLFIAPLFLRHGLRALRTTRPLLHGMRAVLNVIAMLAFFYGLSLAPLAEVAALGFTAPIYATILTMIFLGERVGIRRWSAILLGFAGTFVVLRPGLDVVGPGQLLVLFSAATWGCTLLIIKVLGRTDSSVTITAYMVLLLAPLSLVPALFVWQWPTPEQLAWAALIGAVGTAAQFLMTHALKMAETAVVMPLDFLKLVWAAILGYAFFAQVPDMFTWIGGAMIFASAAYIAYRENKLRHARATERSEDRNR